MVRTNERFHPCVGCENFNYYEEVECLKNYEGLKKKVDIPICGFCANIITFSRCKNFEPSDIYKLIYKYKWQRIKDFLNGLKW